MSDHNFYELTNNHNQREITIANVALLVGKAPTKEKRIRINVRMVLSGHPNMGAPDWLSAGADFVSRWHDPVYPEISFKRYDLHFNSDNLFGPEGVKSPRCQICAFEIVEAGSAEEPDVVVNFKIYAPFSTALWSWLGAYGGDSCWCSFTPGMIEDSSAADEDADDDENEEAEEESIAKSQEAADGFFGTGEGDAEEENEEPADPRLAVVPTKSGPKSLAAFHEAELDKEAKKARGKKKVAEEF